MRLEYLLQKPIDWRPALENISSISGHRSIGMAKAIGHAWIELRRHTDDSIVVAVNDHVALRFIALDGKVAVQDARAAETNESYGACGRAAVIAACYDDLLKAHNAIGDLLQSGRRFLLRSEENERAGLQDNAIDWTKRLTAAMRAMLDEFAGPDAALTVEQHAIADTLREFLPNESALETVK